MVVKRHPQTHNFFEKEDIIELLKFLEDMTRRLARKSLREKTNHKIGWKVSSPVKMKRVE